MLERIVVGYDGSRQARAAYDTALMLAKATGAKLEAVYVQEPGVADMLSVSPAMALDPLAPPAMPPPLVTEVDVGPPQNIVNDLEAFKHECHLSDVPFETHFARGTLVDFLVRHSGVGDLLAIGLTGRFATAGLGSTARALTTQAPCPVLVANQLIGPVNRVMTVFDSTAPSAAALAFALDLGRQTGWPVTVLAMARGDTTLEQSLARAQSLAPGALVLPLGDDRGDRGDAWQAQLIDQATESNRFALLVMGAYADSAIKDLLLGSRTGHVLAKLGGAAILVHA